MRTFKIFLSGSVQKAVQKNDTGKTYWDNEDEQFLKTNLIFPIELLNPNLVKIDQNNSEERFRQDLIMLLQSDLVIVDARGKKGIGIGSEMTLAKMYKIPVYSICPQASHYRKSVDEVKEWIHPFIFELSDKVFDSQQEVTDYLNELYTNGMIKNKPPIDIVDVLDRLNGYDAGYDEGYSTVEKFWGTKPAGFVQLAADLLKKRNTDNPECLDLGCGHGKNAIFLAEQGFQVTAMDASYYCIKEARKLNKKIEWKVRDMRKLQLEQELYDLIVLTGSLHCLSTSKEVVNVVNNVKLATKIGGYNVVSAFNDGEQDLSGHSQNFHPLLLSHDKYINMYKDWKIIESSNTILEDEHPHNNIKHRHSISRIIAQRVN